MTKVVMPRYVASSIRVTSRIDTPFDDPDYPEWHGWNYVEDSIVGERRWGVTYELIVKSPDGRFWIGDISYPVGDGDSYRDEDVVFMLAKPVQKTITVYEVVKD